MMRDYIRNSREKALDASYKEVTQAEEMNKHGDTACRHGTELVAHNFTGDIS